MSFIIWAVMNMMAEMVTFLPLPGYGPQYFCGEYVSSSIGFAISWIYYYSFSILVATEVTAGAILINYWPNTVPTAVWITILLGVSVFLNITSVKFFGESEFYFAFIKVIAIVGLIILGIVLFFGGGPNHDRLGFRYWKDGMAFKSYLVDGKTGQFLGFWYAVIRSGYAFICSPELITIAAGEAEHPRKNIPKAANRFIYRLAFFYIFGTLVIGVICNSNSQRLLNGSDDASASPFVIGIQNASIPILNHIINGAILTSAASSGNAFLYTASRVLYSNAKQGIAPAIFKKTNRFGVPYFAVSATGLFGCLAYLNSSSSSADVFNWLSNLSTISGFLAWITVGFAYLRWRKAIVFHGLSERVTYRTPFQPYTTYAVIFFVSLICITNGFSVFFHFNGPDFVAAYITFPILVALYVGHMIYEKVKFGRFQWLRPIEDIDLLTGLDLIEQEESEYVPQVPRNIFERIWFWIC